MSVKISKKRKLKENSRINKIKRILKKSKVNVHIDKPKNVKKQNIKYIKNRGE